MKKYSILIFIVGLIALLLIQKKAVMPLVYKVVQSDLFLVESKDQGSQAPISTPLTKLAFAQCNNYIKTKLSSDASVSFPEAPLNAWSLGNYQFVINAEAEITTPSTASIPKKYVCRISYKNGDNIEDANNPDNWSIEGLSGLN